MKIKLALLCSAMCFAAVGAAVAQTASPGPPPTAGQNVTQLEEVVVTARKREESLQQIPAAVTSISGQQLVRQGIRQTTDLARAVPSLYATESLSSNTSVIFSLRGQSPGDLVLTVSQAVGLYEDSVNIPHPVGTNAAFFDLSRIEVLKGPQGTLYGRNTTGGAVNLITRGADYNGFHGYLYGEGGNYDDWKVAGALNIPLIKDMLAARVAYQHWNREGFGESTVTGQRLGQDRDDDVARLSIKFDPASFLTSTTKLEFFNFNRAGQLSTLRYVAPNSPPGLSTLSFLEAGLESGASLAGGLPGLIGGGIAALNAQVSNNIFANTSQIQASDKVRGWHFVEDATWDITDTVSLRSITGYHRIADYQVVDTDTTSFQINELNAGAGGVQPIDGPYRGGAPADQAYHAFTQELDLSGHFMNHLDWLVGAFTSDEKGFGGEVPVIAPLAFAATGGPSVIATEADITSNTWALFTQDDFRVNDVFSITLGGRYTEERNGEDAQKFDFDPLSQTYFCAAGATAPASPPTTPANCPHLVSNEKSNGISYLASFNFQFTPDMLLYVKTARGFRGGGLQFRAPSQPGFKPEFATDYEIGFKSDFLDRRLRANLAAYQTNYDNKQVTSIIQLQGVPTTLIQNAATARIRGFEAEFNAVLTPNWTAYASYSYTEGVFLQYKDPLTSAGTPLGPPGTVAQNVSFPDPRMKYNIGSRYQKDIGPGQAAVQLDWAWRSKYLTTALFGDPFIPQSLLNQLLEPVGLLNGRIDYTLPDRNLTLSFFATNLLDKHYQLQGFPSGTLGFATGITQEPRMWGFSIRKSFGEE